MVDLQKAVERGLIHSGGNGNAVSLQLFTVGLGVFCQRVSAAADKHRRRYAFELSVRCLDGRNIRILPTDALREEQLSHCLTVSGIQKPGKPGKVKEGIAKYLGRQVDAHIMEHQRGSCCKMTACRIADDGEASRIQSVLRSMFPEKQHRVPDLLLRVWEGLHIQLGVIDVYDKRTAFFRHIQAIAVHLAGVKMFSNVNMEDTLLCAASLASHAGSVIGNIFGEVLEGKEKRLYPVENYVYEDSLGLCGWIHSQRVLLGSRDLMKAHNIEGLPSRAREAEMVGPNQEAVYLSVSGNLSAIFLVELRADRLVKFWTKQCAKRGVCLIMRSVDPMITLNRIATTFEIPASMLKIIPARMHGEYGRETAPVENMSASMACTGGFSSLASLIIATKVLRSTAMFGVFVQAVSVLLGIGLVLMEAVLGLGLTPAWMLIFQIGTSLLTMLTVNIRRTY